MALSDSSNGEPKEGETVDEAVAEVEILLEHGGSTASLSKLNAEAEMDRKGFREEREEIELEGGGEERLLVRRKETSGKGRRWILGTGLPVAGEISRKWVPEGTAGSRSVCIGIREGETESTGKGFRLRVLAERQGERERDYAISILKRYKPRFDELNFLKYFLEKIDAHQKFTNKILKYKSIACLIIFIKISDIFIFTHISRFG